MPIHQQLWSLECSVIETVASLLHGVTKHCLAGIESYCLDKVDDIQAVRKSSTDQCNSSGQLLSSVISFISVFPFQETPTLTIRLFENLDLEWNSTEPLWWNVTLFDELILGVCLFHPVFLSDVIVFLLHKRWHKLRKCR